MTRRAEEETSAPLSVGGVEDEQGFGRGIDLLFCLCLAESQAGSVGCHWYFLFWTLVGCWPGLLRMCLRGLLLDYLLFNFLYGLDSGRGGHFYFLPGS
jgi:hypothetical protein